MTPDNDTRTPRERLAALPADRRAALLDPAEKEFADKGYAGASLNRILVAAGMSKGQAYYYISDKADLYSAVIERALVRMLGSVVLPPEPPRTAAEFWANVRIFLLQVTELWGRHEQAGALARGVFDGHVPQEALSEGLEWLRSEIDRLIGVGQELGAVRTDLPVPLLRSVLLGMALELDRWVAEHSHTLSPEDNEGIHARSLDLIRAAAEPPPPGRVQGWSDDRKMKG